MKLWCNRRAPTVQPSTSTELVLYLQGATWDLKVAYRWNTIVVQLQKVRKLQRYWNNIGNYPNRSVNANVRRQLSLHYGDSVSSADGAN